MSTRLRTRSSSASIVEVAFSGRARTAAVSPRSIAAWVLICWAVAVICAVKWVHSAATVLLRLSDSCHRPAAEDSSAKAPSSIKNLRLRVMSPACHDGWDTALIRTAPRM